jgi:hypothetical protein
MNLPVEKARVRIYGCLGISLSRTPRLSRLGNLLQQALSLTNQGTVHIIEHAQHVLASIHVLRCCMWVLLSEPTTIPTWIFVLLIVRDVLNLLPNRCSVLCSQMHVIAFRTAVL